MVASVIEVVTQEEDADEHEVPQSQQVSGSVLGPGKAQNCNEQRPDRKHLFGVVPLFSSWPRPNNLPPAGRFVSRENNGAGGIGNINFDHRRRTQSPVTLHVSTAFLSM